MSFEFLTKEWKILNLFSTFIDIARVQIEKIALPTFGNREIAFTLWLFGIGILGLCKASLRLSLLNILKLIVKPPISTVILIMVLNTWLSISFLAYLNFWNVFLLKETVYWFLFTGLYLVITLRKNTKIDLKSFTAIVLDNFKITAFLEFFVNFYSFSLIIELLLFPFMILVSGMVAFAKTEDKYAHKEKIMLWVLGIMGTVLLINALKGLINHSFDIFEPASQKQFFLGPALTILFIPFLYLLKLYSTYEMLFIRMNFAFGQDQVLRQALKRKILKFCAFNLRKVNGVSSRLNGVLNAKTLNDTNYLFEPEITFTSNN